MYTNMSFYHSVYFLTNLMIDRASTYCPWRQFAQLPIILRGVKREHKGLGTNCMACLLYVSIQCNDLTNKHSKCEFEELNLKNES